MLDVIDALSRDHAAALSAVEGIGLSGQMHGAVLLDDTGAVLRPPFCGTMFAPPPNARTWKPRSQRSGK